MFAGLGWLGCSWLLKVQMVVIVCECGVHSRTRNAMLLHKLELVLSRGLHGGRLVLVDGRVDARPLAVLLEQDEFLREIWRHGGRNLSCIWFLALCRLLRTPTGELNHWAVLLWVQDLILVDHPIVSGFHLATSHLIIKGSHVWRRWIVRVKVSRLSMLAAMSHCDLFNHALHPRTSDILVDRLNVIWCLICISTFLLLANLGLWQLGGVVIWRLRGRVDVRRLNRMWRSRACLVAHSSACSIGALNLDWLLLLRVKLLMCTLHFLDLVHTTVTLLRVQLHRLFLACRQDLMMFLVRQIRDWLRPIDLTYMLGWIERAPWVSIGHLLLHFSTRKGGSTRRLYMMSTRSARPSYAPTLLILLHVV